MTGKYSYVPTTIVSLPLPPAPSTERPLAHPSLVKDFASLDAPKQPKSFSRKLYEIGLTMRLTSV